LTLLLRRADDGTSVDIVPNDTQLGLVIRLQFAFVHESLELISAIGECGKTVESSWLRIGVSKSFWSGRWGLMESSEDGLTLKNPFLESAVDGGEEDLGRKSQCPPDLGHKAM
jgi:hypothetical protein